MAIPVKLLDFSDASKAAQKMAPPVKLPEISKITLPTKGLSAISLTSETTHMSSGSSDVSSQDTYSQDASSVGDDSPCELQFPKLCAENLQKWTVKNTFLHFPGSEALFVEGFQPRKTKSAPASEAGDVDIQLDVPRPPAPVLCLAEVLPEPELGSLELPTVGSIGHRRGRTCRPCAFMFREPRCNKGVDCQFCHLCEPGEKKRRLKQKKAIRNMQAVLAGLIQASDENSSSESA